MVKRRRLGDLYVTGKEIEVDDGQGAVAVWMQKLNPFEHEQVLRRATAARAKFYAYRKAPESEEFQLAHGDAMDFGGREVLIEFLIMNDMAKARLSAEARIAADDEWSDKDYLQGLQDAWLGGMQAKYAEDPEDEEAKTVFQEMKRYANLVEDAVATERKGLKRDYDSVSDEALEHDAADRFLDRRGDQAFVREYARHEIFLATRHPDDHKKRYFDTREELDSLAREVTSALETAYYELSVSPQEGKGLPPTRPSSASSEEPEKAVPVAPSGLSVVSQ